MQVQHQLPGEFPETLCNPPPNRATSQKMRHLMADKNRVTVDITSGIGTLSFPRLFASTANDKTDDNGNKTGEKSYDIQIIIPKSQREDLRALLLAIKTVGEAKWGANWKKVRTPLRDGDAERDELTEDGTTKGEKYPERDGCYFLNARSTKPVAVVDRQRAPIQNPDEVYGGCKGKIAVTFYPYSTKGNHGIGVALNGVQKISDGEPFGGGAPAVESMFDLLDEDEDGLDTDLLDEEPEVEEEVEVKKPAAKKAAATKAKPAAKKAAAKKAAAPEPEVEEDDLLGEEDGEEDDLYADLE